MATTGFLSLLACFSSSSRRKFLAAAKQGDDRAFSEIMTRSPEVVYASTWLNKRTALHIAAEKGHVGILAAVLESLLVSVSGDDGCAKQQLNRRDSTLSQALAVINSRDAEGRTPLIIACGHGHSDCVRLLLSNGAWRELSDVRGNTPVHYAAAKNQLGILLLLLTEFMDELTAEQQAQGVPEDSLPSVKRLVEAQNNAGFAPLSYAVWAKQSGAVQVLLQHGADLLTRNERVGMGNSIPCPARSTPLHLAAMRGHIEISRLLLKSHYERVMEPLQLSLAAAPLDATESITRALTSVDPRTQHNGTGHMPYKVAQRAGFLALASLLRPQIPLVRLFNEEEHRARFYGPPALKLLAAEALNRKLLASLDSITAACEAQQEGDSTQPSRRKSLEAAFTATTQQGDSRRDTSSSAGQHTRQTAESQLLPVREDEEPCTPTPTHTTHFTPTTLPQLPRNAAPTEASPFAAVSFSDGFGVAQAAQGSGVAAVELPQLPGTAAESTSRGVQGESAEISFWVPPPPPPASRHKHTRSMDASLSVWRGTAVPLGQAEPQMPSTQAPSTRGVCSASGTRGWVGEAVASVPLSPQTSGPLPSVSQPAAHLQSPPPGITVLQRGHTLTLTGASRLSSAGSMSVSIAQVMRLREVSEWVEDPGNAQLRNRLGSCMPRLSSQQVDLEGGEQEDSDEVPDSYLPPLVTTGGHDRRGSLDARLDALSPHHPQQHAHGTPPAHPASPTSVAGASGALRAMRRTLSGLRKSLSGNAHTLMDVSQIHPLDAPHQDDDTHTSVTGMCEDEDDMECGVCMEHPARVAVQPCKHTICGPCAKKMLSLGAQKTPYCPFCRSVMSDFQPAALKQRRGRK